MSIVEQLEEIKEGLSSVLERAKSDREVLDVFIDDCHHRIEEVEQKIEKAKGLNS